jgi:isopentenyldiphosphate isomerase
MADELMDICDENNNVVGQGMKSHILKNGLWHRTARVFIYNSAGEILIQLRGKDKELYPDRWDVGAAGHVAAGENYLDTAVREAQEELGLSIAKESLDLLTVEKFEQIWGKLNEKVFAGTYLAKYNGSINDLKIQAEEVQELKFIPADDLVSDLKSFPEKYSPHPKDYWQLLIDGVRKLTRE